MPTTNPYPPGAQVVIRFTFKDAAGTLTDPDTADLDVQNPSGVTTTSSLSAATHESTGVFALTVNIPDSAASVGHWTYRGLGTGTLRCASRDNYFVVVRSVFVQ